MTAENVTWQNEQACRDTFLRVLVSSSDNDPANPDRQKSEDGPYRDDLPAKFERNKAVRYAFLAAISQGATDDHLGRARSRQVGQGRKTDKDEASDD